MARKKKQEDGLTENTRVKLKDVLSGSSKFDYKRIEESVWSDIPYFIPLFPWFDYATSAYEPGRYGGIPGTRLIEVYGPESSGKSTFADILIANVQNKMKGYGIIADYEDAHQEKRMIELGVDPDYTTFIQPKEKKQGSEQLAIEDFFDGTEEAVSRIRSADPDGPILTVCDSLAAAHLREHVDDIGKENIAEYDSLNMNASTKKAKFLSQQLSRFVGRMTRKNVTILIINQIRSQPGVMFGNPEYAPGGKALPFTASLIIALTKGALIEPKDDPIRDHRDPDPVGLEGKFKILKNKVAKRVKEGGYKLYFDNRGVIAEENFLDMVEDRKVEVWCNELEKVGYAWAWRGEKLGRYKKDAIQFLIDNPSVFSDMQQTIFGEPNESE